MSLSRFGIAGVFLVMVLAPARAETPDQKKATVVYLQALQTKEGGFLPAAADPAKKDAKPTLRATSGALRALKYFGGEPNDKAAAVQFVKECFDQASGGFSDTPKGKPDVVSTAVGLMAVVELKIPPDDYSGPAIKFMEANAKDFEEIRLSAAGLEAVGKMTAKAEEWIKQLTKNRNEDGTYGKDDSRARDTGGTIVAILRLGAKAEPQEEIIKTLKAGQREDGGFGKGGEKGSDLESSYRVMRAFHMLKQKPDADKLRALISKCRNKDGGYGIAPGKESTVSSTYFAGIILHWLDEK
ncbi:MAG: prenyltransferase/squalene oxidase repeat-containing protein [Gemmataceae bacterium]